MLEKIKSAATKKIGPFPLWIWGLGGAAAVVIGMKIANGGGSSSGGSTIAPASSVPTTVGAGDAGSATVGAGNSGGVAGPAGATGATGATGAAGPAGPAGPAAIQKTPDVTPKLQPQGSNSFIATTDRLVTGVPITALTPSTFTTGGNTYSISKTPVAVPKSGEPLPEIFKTPQFIYTHAQAVSNAERISSGRPAETPIITAKPTAAMAAFLSKFGYKG